MSQSDHMGNTIRQTRSESDPQGPHPVRHRSQVCLTAMCTDFQAPRPPLPSPLGIWHESAGPICNVGVIKGPLSDIWVMQAEGGQGLILAPERRTAPCR